MEKSFYVVATRPAFVELLRSTASTPDSDVEPQANHRVVVGITQGGFGQDVIDDERQVKERFLEFLFLSSGLDLPRTAEAFDQYFELERLAEFIDLDDLGQ